MNDERASKTGTGACDGWVGSPCYIQQGAHPQRRAMSGNITASKVVGAYIKALAPRSVTLINNSHDMGRDHIGPILHNTPTVLCSMLYGDACVVVVVVVVVAEAVKRNRMRVSDDSNDAVPGRTYCHLLRLLSPLPTYYRQ